MKKIICAFMSLILLCSCSSGTDVRVVNKGVSFEAHIFYFEQKYVCSGEITSELQATFTVKEGALSGFTATYGGEKVRISYEGKESEQDYGILCGALFTPIAEMFLELENTEYSVREQDDNYTVNGNTSAGEFTLYVSPAGLPISANLGSSDFSVEFYDVSVEKTA